MALSKSLVSRFVKVTKTEKAPKKETFVYGKIDSHEEIEVNGEKQQKYYVKIDGSNTKTPVSRFTATVNIDERVIVMIKNHEAIITGNVSSASSTTSYVDEKIDTLGSISPEYINGLWSDYFKS